MASLKITELQQVNSTPTSSLLVIVQNPGGSPTTNSISIAGMLGNVTSNAVFNTYLFANVLQLTSFTTPVSSTDTVLKGKIWADANFIYVATANNVIKRVALSSF